MLANNKVLNSYYAIVKGKSTALAGCNTINCERDCLRKHPQLRYREAWKSDICSAFIPVVNR